MISSATDLPELLCCCFSALAPSGAVTFVLCEYMKRTAETRSIFERKSVISALGHNVRHASPVTYMASL